MYTLSLTTLGKTNLAKPPRVSRPGTVLLSQSSRARSATSKACGRFLLRFLAPDIVHKTLKVKQACSSVNLRHNLFIYVYSFIGYRVPVIIIPNAAARQRTHLPTQLTIG